MWVVERLVVKGDDGVIFFTLALQRGVDVVGQLGAGEGDVVRHYEVKDHIAVIPAAHHAEIVQRQPRVQLRQNTGNSVADGVKLGVVGHNGIIMNHKVNLHVPLDLALDVVDAFMRRQRVEAVVHLGVGAGKAAAGAVVVDDQVVDAEDVLVARNFLRQLMHQRLIRRLAEQRVDGVARDADARPEDQQRNAKAHIAVHTQPRKVADQAAEQDRCRGDRVVAAVGSGGGECGGMDALAELGVEQRHPELDTDGNCQHDHDQNRKFDRLRVQDLAERAEGQLRADDENERRDHKTGKIFIPAVAVGVLVVGGLRRQLKAEQRYDGAGRVGEVIHRVGGDGNAAAERTGQQLARKQQQIAHDADQPRQPSVGGANLRRVGILIIADKEPQQKRGHSLTSKKSSKIHPPVMRRA